MPKSSSTAVRLSFKESDRETYSATKVSGSTIVRYIVSSSAHTTSPTASNRKLQRSVRVEAPKTLQILTARSRTGISAKKKLTKFISAMATTRMAMPRHVSIVDLEPCSWSVFETSEVSK